MKNDWWMMVITSAAVAGGLILCLAIGVFGGTDGETEGPAPEVGSILAPGSGEFFARVELQKDHDRVDEFWAEVKVRPNEGQWPGVVFNEDEGSPDQTSVHMTIKIRGLSVPKQFPMLSRPHIQVERERGRFDAAVKYVWALISNAETLILANPEVSNWRTDTIVCDVFVLIGGVRLNLATMMINDDYARPDGKWDWGSREIKELK